MSRYRTRDTDVRREIVDVRGLSVVFSSSANSDEKLRNIRASDAGLELLCTVLNDIEELKERIEKRPEPVRPESEELRLCRAQLSALRNTESHCWTLLSNDGFVRQSGETLPQALSRYVNGVRSLRSAVREERAERGEPGAVAKVVECHGGEKRAGETDAESVHRLMEEKREEIAKLHGQMDYAREVLER